MTVLGADGIPMTGKVKEYATQLWLEGPSAFWLHPEGPLSDTTPEEYQEAQRKKRGPFDAIADVMNARAASAGMLNSYANASQLAGLAQAQAQQIALHQHKLLMMNSVSGNINSVLRILL